MFEGIELYHRGERIGALTRYAYETPWAGAWLVTHDQAPARRYAAICAFLSWADALPDDLPDAESDARYRQELQARGLTEADVDGFWGGWQVRMPDGALHDVYVSDIDERGAVTWRW
jgi:hypothetical protein